MPDGRPLFQKLTILVPVYNEVGTIREILQQVDAADAAGVEKELIIVDDGSTDGTREVLQALDGLKTSFRVLFHAQNMGKGAALRTGLSYATVLRDVACAGRSRRFPVGDLRIGSMRGKSHRRPSEPPGRWDRVLRLGG